MSKAILVLDEMPGNCGDGKCPVCSVIPRSEPDDSEYLCESSQKTTKEEDRRPDWCPLRPMPERMKTGGAYKDGWNDAIKAIEGSRK